LTDYALMQIWDLDLVQDRSCGGLEESQRESVILNFCVTAVAAHPRSPPCVMCRDDAKTFNCNCIEQVELVYGLVEEQHESFVNATYLSYDTVYGAETL